MAKLTIWNRGDVVRLKSGGPKMTVGSVPNGAPEGKSGKRASGKLDQYDVSCNWFEGPVNRDGIFDSETITRART